MNQLLHQNGGRPLIESDTETGNLRYNLDHADLRCPDRNDAAVRKTIAQRDLPILSIDAKAALVLTPPEHDFESFEITVAIGDNGIRTPIDEMGCARSVSDVTVQIIDIRV